MSRVRCPSTPSLLDWVPPQPVVRFDDSTVLRLTERTAQLKRALSVVLNDVRDGQGMSREDVCALMSADLGERYTVDRLNADTAESKPGHVMNLFRLDAFCQATGDDRVWSLFLARRRKVVIDDRYLSCIDAAILAEKADEIALALKIAKAKVREGMR